MPNTHCPSVGPRRPRARRPQNFHFCGGVGSPGELTGCSTSVGVDTAVKGMGERPKSIILDRCLPYAPSNFQPNCDRWHLG
jgi:hypothetical protein